LWVVDTVSAIALILLAAWIPGSSPNASAPPVHP
jgi:hypothetical protein